MSSLIQIQYGLDPSGNILSLSVNSSSVGSYRSELNRFYIFLNGIDPSNPVMTSSRNFQTQLEFLAATGSPGATAAGNLMEGLWNNAVFSAQLIYTLDFQTPGFILSQSIVST